MGVAETCVRRYSSQLGAGSAIRIWEKRTRTTADKLNFIYGPPKTNSGGLITRGNQALYAPFAAWADVERRLTGRAGTP